MKRILLTILLFLIPSLLYATVPVNNNLANIPATACTPSDFGGTCSASGSTGNVGIGTINFMPEYIGVSTLGLSNMVDVAGNVGIGSVTPGQLLDVAGTVRQTGFVLSTSPTNNYVLTSDASGNGTWQAATGSGSNYWLNDSGNVGINTTYNVGIGTTEAGSALTVNGTIRNTLLNYIESCVLIQNGGGQ